MVGRTLSHYSILELLGKGGMGEVYRARDEVLGRDVAIKVLPEAFTHDPERLARFEREAKVLAVLNHPHIAAIYGLESAVPTFVGEGLRALPGDEPEVRFLVLELVEGDTLAERLLRGPIPVRDAVPLAIQIAQALEAAHGQGVVHRDLKPANIKITPEGEVKVLDFGLAKPTEATFKGDLAESPTLTYAPTGAGVIMGTAAYMSPEQVRGQEVDKRSDNWAFGVVLWEMLTGKKLFGGDTVSDVLASTLMREPDWEGLPPDLPAAVKRVLKRCLVQDPRDRLHDIADARIELEEAFEEAETSQVSAATKRTPVWMRALPWLAIPIALVGGWLLRPEEEMESPPIIRFEVQAPEGQRITHNFRPGISLSPDGRELIFVAGVLGPLGWPREKQLYRRRLDEWQARPIEGTEDGMLPIVSPDGRWLAFGTFPPPRLHKVPIAGGEAQTLCECEATFGFSWGLQGEIVYASESGPLYQVSSAGGEPRPLTALQKERGEVGHRLPHFLPDGSAVIYTALHGYRDWESSEIVAYSMATGEQKVLIRGGSDGRYVESGHLVFAREGNLFAMRLDPSSFEAYGPVTPVLEGVNHSIHTGMSLFRSGFANFVVSGTGTAAYLSGSVYPEEPVRFVLVDRQGSFIEELALEEKQYLAARTSTDGRRILLTTHYPPNNLWVFDRDRGTQTRETFEGRQGWAVWGPGPDEITFSSYQDKKWSLVTKQIGSGPVTGRELMSGEEELWVGGWSQDGKYLLVLTVKVALAIVDIDIVILSSDGTIRNLLDSRFRETFPDFSPDDRWIAYTSDESGREEVYVRSFPDLGPAVQISTDGGMASTWSRNGREIFYRTDEGEVLAVGIETIDGRIVPTRPRLLFSGEGEFYWSAPVRSWDVTPDGAFLLKTFPDLEEMQANMREFFPDRIQIVQNWTEELHQKVP